MAIRIAREIAKRIFSRRSAGACGRSPRRSRPIWGSSSSKDRPRPIARRATRTRSISSGIARPCCTTRRRTRRRGARNGSRSRRSTVRAPSPRRRTTSSHRCCTSCCASIPRTSSRPQAAPPCRARIPSPPRPDSRCWRRAATWSTRRSPSRSRSASWSPTRAARADTARCSSTRKVSSVRSSSSS